MNLPVGVDPANEVYLSAVSAWQIAVKHALGKLPARHRDPFDCMLVCQAVAHGLVVLTPDPLIEQYPVRTHW